MMMRELNHRVKNTCRCCSRCCLQRPDEQKIRRHARSWKMHRIELQQWQRRSACFTTRVAQRGSALENFWRQFGTARQIFPSNIKIVSEPSTSELDNDAAMPLALILNELLTNAAKYGCNGTGKPSSESDCRTMRKNSVNTWRMRYRPRLRSSIRSRAVIGAQTRATAGAAAARSF